MDVTHRSFLTSEAAILDSVSWGVHGYEDTGRKFYSFTIQIDDRTVRLYGDNEDSHNAMIEELQNLRDEIDAFIDTVEAEDG